MDTTTEQTCLGEISSLIFDAMQKVTLKTISNNWDVGTDVAQKVLEKWMAQNEKKMKEIVKEFLVQGINSKGKFIISVVDEETKKRLEDKWKDLKANLYSVETKSNSRSLDLQPPYEPVKVKNILINPGHRDIKVPVAPPKLVDTTKIKSPFGMVKPLSKKEEEERKKAVAAAAEIPVVEIKREKTVSPKKISPPAPKPSTSKSTAAAGKKNAKPAQKGNISSFFGKPSASKASTSTSNDQKEKKEVEVKKESPEAEVKEKSPEIKMEVSDPEPSRKRSASPPAKSKATVQSKKKPPQKKPKLKEPANKKRSRIQVMEDSSEDEGNDEKFELEERESKLIKFDREETPEIQSRSKSPTPEQLSEPETKKTTEKRKAKRWVTKRFETSDGYIRTEKVLEEYSAGEEEDETENDENRKKNSPPASKASSGGGGAVKKAPAAEKKSSAKAKPKDTVKTKQGSITSFFTKK